MTRKTGYTGYSSEGLGSLHQLVLSLVIGLVLIFGFCGIGRGNCSIIQDILDQSQPCFAHRFLSLQLLLDRGKVFENNLSICFCSTRVTIPGDSRTLTRKQVKKLYPCLSRFSNLLYRKMSNHPKPTKSSASYELIFPYFSWKPNQ